MIPQENHQQICPPKGIQTVGHRLFDEFGQGIFDSDRILRHTEIWCEIAAETNWAKQKFSDKKDLVFRSNQ